MAPRGWLGPRVGYVALGFARRAVRGVPDPGEPRLAHRPGHRAPGDTITVGVGTRYAGQQVHVWMFSTPTLLGTATVAADGTVTATIPADAPAGQHRIVVTAEDGTVLGWTTITIDPVTGALAFTGAEGLGVAALAAFLLLVAGAGVLVLRRRRGTPASE